MKFSLQSRRALVALGALSSIPTFVHAFPTADNLLRLARRDGLSLQDIYEGALKVKQRSAITDPLSDPVDVSGEYAFQAPDLAAGDVRGPCPGLNALANHGYLPHSGVASLLEITTVLPEIMGMALDLSSVLAIMGTVGVGDPLSLDPGFSIGGTTSQVSNMLDNLGGLLGVPLGLDGSHNWIEADSSATRDDLFVTGNAWTMNMTKFMEFHDSVEGDIVTMEDIASRAAYMFNVSVATNPYFYYGPYTGMVARNAGYIFVGRLIANHSSDHPEGQLTKETLRSFFGVYEEDGTYVYREGNEQIPANWYRNPGYGLVDLNIDLVSFVLQYPVLASIGGNMGKVNTFAGVDLDDVTGGVLNAAGLLEGNNMLCLALAVVRTFAPDSLSTLFRTLEVPLQLLDNTIVGPLLNLSCPEFQSLTMGGDDLFTGLKNTYPGANMSGFGF